MKPEEENNLYAKWLAGELTPEEKRLLQNSGDEEVLKKITDTVDGWSLPELRDETFSKIKQRIAGKPVAKVVPLYKKLSVWAIAASVTLIIIVSFFFFPSSKGTLKEFACKAGETKSFMLPDSTLIVLSGSSRLAYYSDDFADNREVELKGEGYFEVNRKGHFQVNFSGGAVKVLGTKFDILSDKELASVKCFEGKVEVDLGTEVYKLEKGEGVRKIKSGTAEKFDLAVLSFDPKQTEAEFENTPLAEICSSISLYYNISFVANDVDMNRSFTGRYKRTSLDTALLMVFEPMGISAKREGSSVILKNK